MDGLAAAILKCLNCILYDEVIECVKCIELSQLLRIVLSIEYSTSGTEVLNYEATECGTISKYLQVYYPELDLRDAQLSGWKTKVTVLLLCTFFKKIDWRHYGSTEGIQPNHVALIEFAANGLLDCDSSATWLKDETASAGGHCCAKVQANDGQFGDQPQFTNCCPETINEMNVNFIPAHRESCEQVDVNHSSNHDQGDTINDAVHVDWRLQFGRVQESKMAAEAALKGERDKVRRLKRQVDYATRELVKVKSALIKSQHTVIKLTRDNPAQVVASGTKMAAETRRANLCQALDKKRKIMDIVTKPISAEVCDWCGSVIKVNHSSDVYSHYDKYCSSRAKYRDRGYFECRQCLYGFPYQVMLMRHKKVAHGHADEEEEEELTMKRKKRTRDMTASGSGGTTSRQTERRDYDDGRKSKMAASGRHAAAHLP
ncbi:hypothetical protein HDE_04646 [Halotydeus destructor]|nr:hypothetical protein HDE_04646 [Halotydeus destructor]